MVSSTAIHSAKGSKAIPFARFLSVAAGFAAGSIWAQTFYWNPASQAPGAEAQRAFNWTAGQDGTGGIAPSDRDDDFNAGVLDPAWKFIDWTRPKDQSKPYVPAAYAFPGNGTLKLTGRGGDLAWAWNEIAAVYRTDIQGNFDVSVRMNGHSGAHDFLKAGIIVWNDFGNHAAGGAFAVMATRDHGFVVSYDAKYEVGDFDSVLNFDQTPKAPAAGPYWLRAVKNGGAYSGYYKLSQAAPWTLLSTCVPQGPVIANSQVGLFLTAHDLYNNATASFDEFLGGGSLRSDGYDLKFRGTNASSVLSAKLGGPLATKSVDFNGYSGVFSFLNQSLGVSGDADFGTGMKIIAGGGSLFLNGSGSQTLSAGDTLPALAHPGTSTIRLGSNLRVASLSQSAGSLDLNGKDLNILGSLSVVNGSPATFIGLGGRTIAVGGNADIAGNEGSLVNLDPVSDWFLKVGGTLTARFASIGKSNALGAYGSAADNCVNQGGNTNWRFANQIPLVFTRQTRDTSVIVGQRAEFSAVVSGDGPITLAWRREGDTTILSRDTVLVIPAAAFADDGARFQCLAANAAGKAASEWITLHVRGIAASIGEEPQDVSVKAGENAVFSAGVSGLGPLAFRWQRTGDTVALSTDSVFVLTGVAAADSGKAFTLIVTNAYGKDTSRSARLKVRACDSVFQVSPDSVEVDEGQRISIRGTATCSDGFSWAVVSGPAPKLLDPEILDLEIIAPRVGRDTVMEYRFTAAYGTRTEARRVRVLVKDAVPDPRFTLTAPATWNGAAILTLKPILANLAELQSAKYHPQLRYQWAMSDSLADTAQAGDSLVLERPFGSGPLNIQLCMDNGGPTVCSGVLLEITTGAVRQIPARETRRFPVALKGGWLMWTANARIQVWSLQGRLLWERTGKAGYAVRMENGILRALLFRQAWLETVRADGHRH